MKLGGDRRHGHWSRMEKMAGLEHVECGLQKEHQFNNFQEVEVAIHDLQNKHHHPLRVFDYTVY